MAKEQVAVPDIGGGEAEVIEVLVQVGDEISLEQGVIVLESDKASMEIPSSLAGKVTEVLVSEGQQLAEGAAILTVETDAEAGEDSGTDEVSGAGAAAQAAPAGEAEPAPAAADSAAQQGAPAATEPQAASGAEQVVTVPDIGTDDEVDLVEISVAVGDTVAEGDSLVVLESDKASMEVPSPAAGEVLEVRVSEGQKVRQGSELLLLRSAAGATSPPETAPVHAPAPASEPAAEKAPPASSPAPARPAAPEAGSTGAEVYAGPAVRKLAREFGIDLRQVKASGPRGRILKEDLHAFSSERLNAPAAAAAGAGIPAVPEVDFSRFGEVEVVERTKLEKLTSDNMHRSWLNVPHVTQYDDADVTELEEFRASLKGAAEKRGTRVTPLPFLLKACAVALKDNPKFCSAIADGGNSLVYKKYIHIGIAVDTPAGLLVPVIRDVDKKGIWELSEEVLDLADKARERKLSAAQMQGGCFTISSLGAIGGTGFSPIINTPEVGILGISRTRVAPVWDGEAFAPRKMLPVALSYDHRVVNGADAGRFLTQFVSLLADIRGVIL